MQLVPSMNVQSLPKAPAQSRWVNHLLGALVGAYCVFGCLPFITGPGSHSQYVCSAIGLAIGLFAVSRKDGYGRILMSIGLGVALWMFFISVIYAGSMRVRLIMVVVNV